MKLLQRGVALALLTTFTLASETALAAQKPLVDGIRKEVEAEGGSVLLLSGGDINTGVPESA